MARTKVTFFIDHADDEDGIIDADHKSGVTERGYGEISDAVSHLGGEDLETEIVE